MDCMAGDKAPLIVADRKGVTSKPTIPFTLVRSSEGLISSPAHFNDIGVGRLTGVVDGADAVVDVEYTFKGR